MGKTLNRTAFGRTVAAADPAFPANQPVAPTSLSTPTYGFGIETTAVGVWPTDGASYLEVDIAQTTTSTANTYEVLAWNSTASLWFSTLKIATSAGVQTLRVSVPTWTASFCWVNVTGATVAATIYVLAPIQT
jgi:hypothetical protein